MSAAPALLELGIEPPLVRVLADEIAANAPLPLRAVTAREDANVEGN